MAQISVSGVLGVGRLGHPQWFIPGNTSNIDTYRRGFSEVARIYPAVNDAPRVPTREAVEVFGNLWWLGSRLVEVNTRHSGDLRFTWTDGSDAWPQPGADWQGPLLERPVLLDPEVSVSREDFDKARCYLLANLDSKEPRPKDILSLSFTVAGEDRELTRYGDYVGRERVGYNVKVWGGGWRCAAFGATYEEAMRLACTGQALRGE